MKPVNDPEARRTALHVVAENPCLNFDRPCRRRDKVPIILPQIDMFHHEKWKFESELLGLTDWQRDRAWQIVCRDKNPDKYRSYGQAINRVFLLWQVLGLALEWERREILAILQEHHPAMARKIMRDLQKKPKGKAAK